MLPNAKIIYTMYECMKDCVTENSKLFNTEDYKNIKDYNITSAWINDMKDGEWNPPHTHNVTKEGVSHGWSTVLFLKAPEMKPKGNLHKTLLNGRITFTDVHGEKVTSFVPEVGDFYIFDSKHQHFVMPVQLKDPLEIRRSLSFNFQIIKINFRLQWCRAYQQLNHHKELYRVHFYLKRWLQNLTILVSYLLSVTIDTHIL